MTAQLFAENRSPSTLVTSTWSLVCHTFCLFRLMYSHWWTCILARRLVKHTQDQPVMFRLDEFSIEHPFHHGIEDCWQLHVGDIQQHKTWTPGQKPIQTWLQRTTPKSCSNVPPQIATHEIMTLQHIAESSSRRLTYRVPGLCEAVEDCWMWARPRGVCPNGRTLPPDPLQTWSSGPSPSSGCCWRRSPQTAHCAGVHPAPQTTIPANMGNNYWLNPVTCEVLQGCYLQITH